MKKNTPRPDEHLPHETASANRWFESAIQLLIFYSIGSYYAEAELSQSGYTVAGTGFWLWNERAIATLFCLEYAYRWSRAKNRWRYPVTLLAMLDLVAILPLFVSLAVDLRSLRLIRTLRILRLFKLYRYNTALQNVLHGFRKVKEELAIVGFVVAIMIMFSSVAMYEFEHDVQPQKFARLSDAVWWSFVTLTTVGYGDIFPITLGGRVIAMATMIVGIGIVGTFISLIGSSFITTMREGERHPPQPHLWIKASTRVDEPSEAPWINVQAPTQNSRLNS